MRKLYISDIHGCYSEMIELFQAASYMPHLDQLVVGGDMIDRGPDSAKVLRQIRSLQIRYSDKVKVIMGNHEDMMGMWLAADSQMWMNCGGYEAYASFDKEFTQEELDAHLQWAMTRPYIEEDDEYVYVHAGLIPSCPVENQPRQECLWMPYTQHEFHFDRMDAKSILDCTGGRKVIYGHQPKPYIFDDGARICCDLGASVKPEDAKLALVDLTGDMYWYYDFDTKQIKTRKIARKREGKSHV